MNYSLFSWSYNGWSSRPPDLFRLIFLFHSFTFIPKVTWRLKGKTNVPAGKIAEVRLRPSFRSICFIIESSDFKKHYLMDAGPTSKGSEPPQEQRALGHVSKSRCRPPERSHGPATTISLQVTGHQNSPSLTFCSMNGNPPSQAQYNQVASSFHKNKVIS